MESWNDNKFETAKPEPKVCGKCTDLAVEECDDCGEPVCLHTLVEYEYDAPDSDIGWIARMKTLCEDCANERQDEAKARREAKEKR